MHGLQFSEIVYVRWGQNVYKKTARKSGQRCVGESDVPGAAIHLNNLAILTNDGNKIVLDRIDHGQYSS